MIGAAIIWGLVLLAVAIGLWRMTHPPRWIVSRRRIGDWDWEDYKVRRSKWRAKLSKLRYPFGNYIWQVREKEK